MEGRRSVPSLPCARKKSGIGMPKPIGERKALRRPLARCLFRFHAPGNMGLGLGKRLDETPGASSTLHKKRGNLRSGRASPALRSSTKDPSCSSHRGSLVSLAGSKGHRENACFPLGEGASTGGKSPNTARTSMASRTFRWDSEIACLPGSGHAGEARSPSRKPWASRRASRGGTRSCSWRNPFCG